MKTVPPSFGVLHRVYNPMRSTFAFLLQRLNHAGSFRLILSGVSSFVLLFFCALAVAAPPASKPKATVPPLPTPHVTFEKGLLSVEAEKVEFQTLLTEIKKKTGIGISLNDPILKKQEITVKFEGVALEEGLKTILRNAGIVSHALVYKQSQAKGKPKQWIIESILLEKEGVTKTVISEGKSVDFIDASGKLIKSYKLLNKKRQGRWSEVTISKNKKFILINNIHEYNVEMVEKADMMMLDENGTVLWEVEQHGFSSIVPSTNGRYAIGAFEESSGDAPLELFNDEMGVRIPKDDVSWTFDFSMDGSFVAISIVRYDKTKGGRIDGDIADMVVFNELGKEMWRKEAIAKGASSHNTRIVVLEDNSVEFTTGVPESKIYRFDQQGNPLER